MSLKHLLWKTVTEPLCAEIITLKLPGNCLPCAGLQDLVGSLHKWWISKRQQRRECIEPVWQIKASLFSFFVAEPLRTWGNSGRELLDSGRDTKLGSRVFTLKSLFSSADFLQVSFTFSLNPLPPSNLSLAFLFSLAPSPSPQQTLSY